MTMKSALSLFAKVVALLAVACHASDPSTYFGGSNHQEYLDWVNSADFIDQYPASLYFSPTPSDELGEDEGLALHWNIVKNEADDRLSYLQIAVAVRAMGGWVGFGLAEAGGMKGADVMLFESENPYTVRDAHILQERLPITDDCQDWELIGESALQEGGFLMVQARRLLNTGDTQDKVVIADDSTYQLPTRIIGAWGNTTTTASYHGPRRIRGVVRFHRLPSAIKGEGDPLLREYDLFQQKMASDADGYFEIRNKNHTIAAEVTVYHDFCITWRELLAQNVPDVPLHIIGFEPLLEASTAQYWHHFSLSGKADNGDDFPCKHDPLWCV